MCNIYIYIAYVYIAVISMYNNCTLVVKLNSNVWSTLCHRKKTMIFNFHLRDDDGYFQA